MNSRHIRIVSLWVREGQEAEFESFEKEAAWIMARHGGRIDQAIRIMTSDAEATGNRPYEVHIVSFPDRQAFEAYAADPAALALRDRRERIISRTQVMIGHDAGPY